MQLVPRRQDLLAARGGGDEDNYGAGITIDGAGPMPSWDAIPVALIPSSGAAVRGLGLSSSGRYTRAYDPPSGGTGIVLSRNTIAPGSNGGLYVQVAEWGLIDDNVWLAGPMTLVAVGGAGNTAVSDNVFNGPVEMDGNHMDFGGGAGSSTGHNQFIGNGMSWFEGTGVMARDNHWRHAPPTVSPTFAFGPSDYDMYLANENTTVDTTGHYQGLMLTSRGAAVAPVCTASHSVRRIFSILRPFASSSTSLSRYRTCCVSGLAISSTR